MMKEKLYQKSGFIIGFLAQELMEKDVGDRILSISEYVDKYQVSRGTIQNAFAFLKNNKAISLRSRGHLGTYVDNIDYLLLQQCSIKDSLLGSMPLPYSALYEGFATALYHELSSFRFNMAYIRGAETRIRLVVQGAYDFAVCSEYAARHAIEKREPIKILMNFGDQTYLSRHVLVLKDENAHDIQDGMRVAYDSNSYDQKNITMQLTKGKNIQLVEMRSNQTILAISKSEIDAGIWNYDEVVEQGYQNLNIVEIDDKVNTEFFSKAVIVISNKEKALENMLMKFISPERVRQIQSDVKTGKLIPSY